MFEDRYRLKLPRTRLGVSEYRTKLDSRKIRLAMLERGLTFRIDIVKVRRNSLEIRGTLTDVAETTKTL